jgi:hypothetical protein
VTAYLKALGTLLALGFLVVALGAGGFYVYAKAYDKGKSAEYDKQYQQIKRLCHTGEKFFVDDRAYNCVKSVST